MHDPKARDVIERCVEIWFAGADGPATTRDAVEVLDALADAGLVVVSDAAEPPDAEQRAAALEAAQHRQTFTEGT